MATIVEALTIAVQHQQAGSLDQAENIYRQILAFDPNQIDALHFLGLLSHQSGKSAEGIELIQRAISLNGNVAALHSNLGNVFKEQNRLAEAVACHRRAVELKPDFAEAHNNLGNALKEQGNVTDAIASYRTSVHLKPNYAEAFRNLGNALKDQGDFAEAVACNERAVELNPNFAEAHVNLGNALKEQGKFDEAIAAYRKALELKPDYALGHWNLSVVALLLGDWQLGWQEYEWRFQVKDFPNRIFSKPAWDGQPVHGKTILLYSEQGLGDTIQFVRYAPLVKQLGGNVILQCHKALFQLLQGLPGVDHLITDTDEPPTYDTHAAILSLPGIFKTTNETIPAPVPYLSASSPLIEKWKTRLAAYDGFKIGINWQGSVTFRGDRFRSIPLRNFTPLSQVPNVHLISLQKGVGTKQLTEVRNLFPVIDLADELDQDSGPFMDTAAVMKNLDLVVTSDTSIAHLAGALGVPTWVALPAVPDWRWQLSRPDNPWYPTLRLFRKSTETWKPVFQEMEQALRQMADVHSQ
jgi:tetratricopeptide (TPR) repeat protein